MFVCISLFPHQPRQLLVGFGLKFPYSKEHYEPFITFQFLEALGPVHLQRSRDPLTSQWIRCRSATFCTSQPTIMVRDSEAEGLSLRHVSCSSAKNAATWPGPRVQFVISLIMASIPILSRSQQSHSLTEYSHVDSRYGDLIFKPSYIP